MKIRHVFEPSDFDGSGQMIIRDSSSNPIANPGFAASVAYKIGWSSGKREAADDRQQNQMFRVSLTDGMLIQFDTVEDLCSNLNEDREGYRPMTDEEIVAVVTEVSNRFAT